MTDDETVAATAETSVGDEGDIFAETFAHDSTGRGKHLSHAWAAFGAFHADDDDVTFLHLVVQDGLECGLF